MKTTVQPILILSMAIAPNTKSCYWCGQTLQTCNACGGTGLYNDSVCKPCKGNGRMCPTHEGNWAG